MKSLQLTTNVFFATNSIRRNVATHTINYLSTSSEFRVVEKTLDAAQTLLLTCAEPMVGFVLLTNKPVTAILTPRDTDLDTVVIAVKKFLFLDQDFMTLEIVAGLTGTFLSVQIA